jgi:flagellum-specific peptidoglycan hydrolase FlgJ
VSDLDDFLAINYNAKLQSVTHGDLLLFARFLPDADFMSSLSIAQLVTQAKQQNQADDDDNNNNDDELNNDDSESDDENNRKRKRNLNDDDEEDEYDDKDHSLNENIDEENIESNDTDDPLTEVFGDENHQVEYIDLVVACQDEDGEDIRLPPVRISCILPLSADENEDESVGSDSNSRRRYNLQQQQQKQSKHLKKSNRKSKNNLLEHIKAFINTVLEMMQQP